MYSYYENSRDKMHAELAVSKARRAHHRVVEKYERTIVPLLVASVVSFVMLLLPADAIGGGRCYDLLTFCVVFLSVPMLVIGTARLSHASRGDYDHEDFMYRN